MLRNREVKLHRSSRSSRRAVASAVPRLAPAMLGHGTRRSQLLLRHLCTAYHLPGAMVVRPSTVRSCDALLHTLRSRHSSCEPGLRGFSGPQLIVHCNSRVEGNLLCVRRAVDVSSSPPSYRAHICHCAAAFPVPTCARRYSALLLLDVWTSTCAGIKSAFDQIC